MSSAALVTGVGMAVVARHRAESAADLAAVSGAGWGWSGEPVACGRARWVVERMRGQLVDCGLNGVELTVRVAIRPPGLLGEFGPASAVAKAGPAVGAGQAVVPAR